jgi:hypothetical protein
MVEMYYTSRMVPLNTYQKPKLKGLIQTLP